MAENKIFEKLSWEDSYPGTEVSAAITGDSEGLHPKLWNRDTVADGKYMQQDTMAKFFYRDMALASAVDELGGRSDNSWKQWSEDHGSSGDDESVWIGNEVSGENGGFAIGNKTIASGYYAHAEGNTTSALSYNAHSEGEYTLANNVDTHAEGQYTSALGYYSHAEGLKTITSGEGAHSEGRETWALGNQSHAEGENTSAYSVASHAEGLETVASGHESHSEGIKTSAYGPASHAEGYNTIAAGTYSHVGGQYSFVKGANSFSHGSYNSAFADDSFVVGCYNHDESNVSGSFIAGNKNSAFSGELNPNQIHDPLIAINIGGGNTLSGEGVNLGKNNSAEDFGVGVGQNLYTRKGSYAFGQYASAEDGSFVFGGNSVSANHGAYAAGRDGVTAENGAVAVGTRTVLAKQGAVAFGHQGISADSGSVVLGQNTVTAAQGSMAVGQNSVFADEGSVAFGKNTISAKTNALAIGQSNTTAENEALAIGLEGVTAQSGAIAFGGRRVSAVLGALAIGFQGATAQEGAIALGMNNVTAANGAMTLGFNGTSAQYGSFAAGFNGTYATYGSVALGYNVSANYGSVGIGECVKANEGSVIVGNYIGYSDPSNRYSVISALGRGSVVLGTDFYLSDTSTITSNSYSLDLVGKSNIAIQLKGSMYGFGDRNLFAQRNAGNGFAMLLGTYNTANSGGAQIAIGNNNFVNDAAIAIGSYNTASSGYTIAIGWQNNAPEGGPWSPSGHGIMLGSRNYNYGSYVKFTPGTGGSEEEEGQYETFNFLIGDSNTAFGHNMFAFGAGNYLGSTDSNITLDRSNDGFAFAYGVQNSAVRNYDMAIGFRSYASGGENIAIGHASAVGYRNIAFDNSEVTGIQNIVLTESKLKPVFKSSAGNIYDSKQFPWALTHNILYNAEYNEQNFDLTTEENRWGIDYGYAHNNILLNGVVNLSGRNICKNIFMNNDTDTNNYKHGYGTISAANIIGNTFIGRLNATASFPEYIGTYTNLNTNRGEVNYNNILMVQ